MSNVTKGNVEAFKNRELDNGKKAYSVLVNDEWFGGFGKECPVKKGDYVEVVWKLSQDGQFKNVSKITVMEKPAWNGKDRQGLEEATRLRRIADFGLKSLDLVIAGKIPMEKLGDTWISIINLFNQVSILKKVEPKVEKKPVTVKEVEEPDPDDKYDEEKEDELEDNEGDENDG